MSKRERVITDPSHLSNLHFPVTEFCSTKSFNRRHYINAAVISGKPQPQGRHATPDVEGALIMTYMYIDADCRGYRQWRFIIGEFKIYLNDITVLIDYTGACDAINSSIQLRCFHHVCFSALFLTSSADSATLPAASSLAPSAFDFPQPSQLNQPSLASSPFLDASDRTSAALRSVVDLASL